MTDKELKLQAEQYADGIAENWLLSPKKYEGLVQGYQFGYKDCREEFKEYLEKKYNEASNSYDKTEAKAYENKMFYINGIINELFGGE